MIAGSLGKRVADRSRILLTVLAALSMVTIQGQAHAESIFKRLSDSITQGLHQSTGGGGTPALPPTLEHIFADTPYDQRKSLAVQYPRVAFTVTTTPPNHNQVILANNVSAPYNHMCWTVSARVWKSRTASTDVAPFQACIPDLLQAPARANSPLRAYMDWFGVKGELRSNSTPGTTSGANRTSGPLPPENPFPQGVRAQRYFQAVFSQVGPMEWSGEAWVWAAILYHMDFDPMQLDNRRVWLVSVPYTQ